VDSIWGSLRQRSQSCDAVEVRAPRATLLEVTGCGDGTASIVLLCPEVRVNEFDRGRLVESWTHRLDDLVFRVVAVDDAQEPARLACALDSAQGKAIGLCEAFTVTADGAELCGSGLVFCDGSAHGGGVFPSGFRWASECVPTA
jgi:hypothetical protein